ncbi:hypothetical protein BCR37DRAFT_125464 [Protomyces lactucae-debilis]|uniref:Uncharacterized protein n=1 Tax=Protomyces lactucae-debilis TaxID=2754530 RepID=A0A1Y2FS17_PROLT|nr:uncharacterized protein BCR37DRAFT_125464 [Protomyces lactucae-debilis]ORY86801.1 hypothetical protein BCR37DRAFT_125464 [Protomyces lactucae-debilis]
MEDKMDALLSDSPQPDADPACNGCKQIIEEGSVVSFGDHIWHVECFRCAKCKTLVDHDSNLLLLSDGNPICENCSYNCRVCNKKIDDLAIMTGDESYHAECFCCRSCHKRIEDLVFAKTSQGIYCILCHNERMNKIRKTAKHNKTNDSASPSSSPGVQTATGSGNALPKRSTKDKNLPQIPRARPAGNTLRSFDRAQGRTEHGSSTRSSRRESVETDQEEGTTSSNMLKESGSIPLLVQGSPEQSKQATTRNVRDSGFYGTTSAGDQRASVRERRNQQELEVKVPKSIEQLEQAVQNNIAARTTSPLMNAGPYGPVQTRRSQETDQEEGLTRGSQGKRSSLTNLSTRPSQFDSSGEQTDATTSRHAPPVPSRSSERNVVNADVKREELMGNTLISGPLHLSPNPPPLSPLPLRNSSTGSLPGARRNSEIISPGSSTVTLTKDTFLLPKRDAPQTPAVASAASKDRRVSSPTTSGARRHLASKSLESSPLLPGLGSPGMTLESEFASALGFGTSPNGLGLFPQSGGTLAPGSSGLDRSNTLSKFANKVLHRKSMSGGALPKSPARTATRSSITPEASKEAALEAELQAERKKVAELELKLAQQIEAHEVSMEIAARKRSLAALDAQIVQVEAKNDALLQQQYKLADRTVPLSEWRKSVVADVNTSIRHTRDETSAEIEILIQERNELRRENDALTAYKQQQSLEMANLQQKHQDLQEMNEKLLKQIQSNMANNKSSSSSYLPLPQVPQPQTHTQPPSQVRGRNGSEGSLSAIAYSNTAFGVPPSTSETNIFNTGRQQTQQPPSLSRTVSPVMQNLYMPRPPEHADSMDTVATFSSELDSKLYGSASQSGSNLGLGLGSDMTTPSSTPQLERRDSIAEEETAVVEKVVNRVSGEVTELAPKKFKWKKGGLSKKTFRWGGKNGSTSGGPGDLTTAIISQPYDSTVTFPSGMTTSKSSDKLSLNSNRLGSSSNNTGGMFKRTWASHNNLASQLRSGSAQEGEFGNYATQPASNGSLATLATTSSPGSLFGTDLAVRANLEGRPIPGIITACVGFLEARALEHEGLYRKSGGAGAMKSLVEAFEQSSSDVYGTQSPVTVDFDKFDDINAITSVLKQYLRKLPVPLIRFEAYEGFIGTSAIPDPDIRIRAVTDVLKDLPGAHFETIRFLFRHLQKVTSHAGKNLMTARNLAVVLGPTVIWDHSGEKEMHDMQAKNQSIQFLIEQAHRL